MKYSFQLPEVPYIVQQPVFTDVIRDAGYRVDFSGGKKFFGFYFVRRGGIRYRFDHGETLSLGAGECLFIPGGTCYTAEYLRNDSSVCNFQFRFASPIPPSCASLCRMVGGDAATVFSALEQESLSDPFYMLSRVYTLLWSLSRQQTELPGKFRCLAPAIRCLQGGGAARIGELAALCGMSESGFRQLFHRYTGQSPVAYRNGLRLKRARILLESGEYSTEEAAEAVGFTNLSFFYRCYKGKYGCCPGKQ